MNIQLLSIGNEVVDGFTINTNAAFLAQYLLSAGFQIGSHQVVRDEPEAILEALKGHECLIATGGLGPTIDDITQDVVGTPDFTFPNAVGSAPGLVFEGRKQTHIFLPGVPLEMEAMCRSHLLPYLLDKFPAQLVPRKIVRLIGLREIDLDPFLRTLEDVKIGIYPSYGVMTLHLIGNWESAYQKLVKEYGELIVEGNSLEEAVQTRFVEKGWTLSCAESCTGGALAAQITRLPGASAYFLGSVVSYANEVKNQVLGVDSLEKGAVSEEVVLEMGQGVLDLTGSDFSLAVSGIAGPSGGTNDKPVGTVWAALCEKGAPPKTWQMALRGNREVIIQRSVHALLAELLKRVR